MKKMISTLFVIWLSASLFAASVVKLSGTVTKTGGGLLKEVTVSLKSVSGISTNTGPDGKFFLSNSTQVLRMTSPEELPLEFNIKGSSIVFSPASGSISGRVEFFSAIGKRIFSSSFTGLESSTQRVTLPAFVPGITIVRMNINGKTATCPILRIGNRLYVLDASFMPTPSNIITLAKASADVAVDTLIAKKTGFTDKKTPITTLIDSDITISMDSIVSGTCTPPKAGTSKSNPIFTDVYTADPAVMVDNCTFYITCGHDQGTGGFDLREWYLLKSTDMVTWTRTTPMTLKAFKWTNANAWAGQMIKGKNGKFYWYVPINDIVYSKDRMAIGVAVADNPEGPWIDALGKPLINDSLEMATFGITDIDQTPHTIDPTVFIDDDGQAYLQYGGFWKMVTVKLNPDMITLSGKLTMTTPLDYFESPYLIKRNKIYYEIYARGSANPTSIDYATSSSPMGPWTNRGTILPKMPKVAGQDEPTNHAGVAEFAGEWYIVYHVSNGPGGGGTYKREVAISKLTFNSDGSIKPVTPGAALIF